MTDFCSWDRETKFVVVFGFATPTDFPYVIVIYLHGGGASCQGEGTISTKENIFSFSHLFTIQPTATIQTVSPLYKKKINKEGGV